MAGGGNSKHSKRERERVAQGWRDMKTHSEPGIGKKDGGGRRRRKDDGLESFLSCDGWTDAFAKGRLANYGHGFSILHTSTAVVRYPISLSYSLSTLCLAYSNLAACDYVST